MTRLILGWLLADVAFVAALYVFVARREDADERARGNASPTRLDEFKERSRSA